MTWYSEKISDICGFMPNNSQKTLEWYLVYLYGISFFPRRKKCTFSAQKSLILQGEKSAEACIENNFPPIQKVNLISR